jgi:DNA-binding NtrC family response regulator
MLDQLSTERGAESRAQADGRCEAALDEIEEMREAGGEQLLKSLASNGSFPNMPVVMMTAHGTGPNAMQAMQLGAYDFITKPLDMDQALATVARALRQMELQREVDRLKEQRFRDNSSEPLDAEDIQTGKP